MKFRIVSKSTGNCMTFVQENTPEAFVALGKKGFLKPEPQQPFFAQSNQHFILEKAAHPGYPNAFIIKVANSAEDAVVRYTPQAPLHNLLVWKPEPGNPKQLWVVHDNVIRPCEDLTKSVHFDGNEFKVGEVAQNFMWDLVVESLLE